MRYWVRVRDAKLGNRIVQDYQLDGIVPDHVIEAMRCESAEDLGLCAICEREGRHCHVMREIGPQTYDKFCPSLWHDVLKPQGWTVGELA